MDDVVTLEAGDVGALPPALKYRVTAICGMCRRPEAVVGVLETDDERFAGLDVFHDLNAFGHPVHICMRCGGWRHHALATYSRPSIWQVLRGWFGR